MSELRKGDIVAFRARVLAVEPYSKDGGPQIRARLLPKGKEIGWCVPGEYDFRVETAQIWVGDRVYLDEAHSRIGRVEVILDPYAWVMPEEREGIPETHPIKSLERV